jgi:hypothetical protein
MADEWVDAMFGVNYDDNYDIVMNHVIDNINYHGNGTGGSGGATSNDNGGGNGGDNDDGDDSNRTDDDGDSDDDSDENEDESSSDDEGESFWLRENDRNKLLLCTAGALHMYYVTYVHKEPCMISYNTRMRWLNEVVQGHHQRCVNMFRMDATTLQTLCYDLETQYGLKPSRRTSVIEKVAMFLYTIALGATNRQVQERFQHSGETVSRNFNEVLKTICLLAVDIIKPQDSEFLNTPREIAMNPRFMPHFKVSQMLFITTNDKKKNYLRYC